MNDEGRKRRRGERRTRQKLASLDEMRSRLSEALVHSVADETEFAWIELLRGEATGRGSRVEARRVRQRTLLTRVLDRGRVGSHRTGVTARGEIDAGIRQAIAQARVHEPLPGLPHIPVDETPLPEIGGLFCERPAQLSPDDARALLEEWREGRESLSLEWTHSRVVVVNSRGVERLAEVTSAAFGVRHGRRPGAGRTATAARSIDAIDVEHQLEVTAARHSQGDVGELNGDAVPAVLSAEAAIELVAFLNRTALTANSYSDGTSFLREHLGVQVFDRAITLRDNATSPLGIPFPFDLEGSAKRPVDMIRDGTPKTPALDQRQAAQLGLPPTAHSISGNDARAENLFLLPGEASEETLLAGSDGGIWIGWLDGVAPIEPRRLRFFAHARGVRRIREGRLAEALPDCVWDDSLLRCLSENPEVGSTLGRRLSRDGVLGGVSAPALRLSAIGGLTPSAR